VLCFGGNARDRGRLRRFSARLIGDRAYDSDPLDKRRWCVERLFAWLQWFRRLVTRYEYHIENYLGMARLGGMRIMLRYL